LIFVQDLFTKLKIWDDSMTEGQHKGQGQSASRAALAWGN